MTTLLRQGNGKVGPNVWTWSLPAIATCPGATDGPDGCVSGCYATKGYYSYPSLQQALIKRWELSEQADRFVALLSKELDRLADGTVIRIHASGDFFSVEYIRAWVELANLYSRLTFYAYTRSWRVKELRAELNRLRKLANVTIWASTDVETGRAPKGWHRAHLESEFADGMIACMEQVGTKENCGKCGLCWKVRDDRPVKLSFKLH